MTLLLLGLVVFKLNVQAVLDPHLHLDWVVDVRVSGQLVDDELVLFHQVGQTANYGHPEKIPAERADDELSLSGRKSFDASLWLFIFSEAATLTADWWNVISCLCFTLQM